jgi:hypothetical protein
MLKHTDRDSDDGKVLSSRQTDFSHDSGQRQRASQIGEGSLKKTEL